MKNLTIVAVCALCLALPAFAFADISLSVSATMTSGTTLASNAFAIVQCDGWAGNSTTEVCSPTPVTSLGFGTLEHQIPKAGTPRPAYGAAVPATSLEGAGCVYSRYFFKVLLYPDAWGGAGYDLQQKSAMISLPAAQDALLMTPNYSEFDRFDAADPTSAQGAMSPTEISANIQLKRPVLAAKTPNASIFKSRRGRIATAIYSIPNIDPSATRPTGWKAIPQETQAQAVSGSVVFTLVAY